MSKKKKKKDKQLKPFVCPVCFTRFDQSQLLTSHCENHEKNELAVAVTTLVIKLLKIEAINDADIDDDFAQGADDIADIEREESLTENVSGEEVQETKVLKYLSHEVEKAVLYFFQRYQHTNVTKSQESMNAMCAARFMHPEET